ncbi:E3 ubiquitin-protein ligase [Melia azedarach]|uniref:E3 ubiquitin-protein ligase n=2 Tax=Melia azedarach TaxID=155640 RepID=A0ACC1X8F9_MELAZ|nr:E3 ubiquitin-protein ligase [Melia azedarach]KAJ4706969.1 E3 ubiquitin-protein ligase [Melia azedarach]
MGRATKSGSCEGVIEGTSSRRFTKRRRVSQPQARVREETPEEKVDSEEDCQENKEKENEEAGDNDGSISVTLTDHEVLDCPICFEPLSNPVFQDSFRG